MGIFLSFQCYCFVIQIIAKRIINIVLKESTWSLLSALFVAWTTKFKTISNSNTARLAAWFKGSMMTSSLSLLTDLGNAIFIQDFPQFQGNRQPACHACSSYPPCLEWHIQAKLCLPLTTMHCLGQVFLNVLSIWIVFCCCSVVCGKVAFTWPRSPNKKET